MAQIARDLRRASASFLSDLESLQATRGLYEANTRIAARRVGELAHVHGNTTSDDVYLEELVTAVMLRLHSGGFSARGISDADVVRRLAGLLTRGVSMR